MNGRGTGFRIVPRPVVVLKVLCEAHNAGCVRLSAPALMQLITGITRTRSPSLFFEAYTVNRWDWFREEVVDDLYALETLGLVEFDGRWVSLTGKGVSECNEIRMRVPRLLDWRDAGCGRLRRAGSR